MASSNPDNPQPPTLLTLPTELRLKIYKQAISETKIVCGWFGPGREGSEPWSSVRKSRADPHYVISVTSSANLLLVSAQVHREAKALVYAMPVNLAMDANYSRIQLQLAPYILNGIKELTLKSNKFIGLSIDSQPLGIALSDRAVLPNLKTIRMTNRDVYGNAAPEGPYYNIEYPIHVDCVITQMLEKDKTFSRSELLQVVLTNPRDDSVIEQVRQTKDLIEERGLVLKGEFRFVIYITTTFPQGPCFCISGEQWYKAIITWDKKGVSIKNLPNLRDEPCWRILSGIEEGLKGMYLLRADDTLCAAQWENDQKISVPPELSWLLEGC
ncbi:hypothetical protein H2200_002483 [Cladophialophora chaetospira]|uniref:Uncharacterized protein n=1 Tax=Cladophialophora chaetospira TaxID=386627 RepID=A0AA39CN48_9EURO|nr:hypothetical protein H2200_002483 [Cladophialophora chaetospira]